MYGHRCVISHISVLLSSSAAGCSSYLCHVLQTQPLDIPFLGFHQTSSSIKVMLEGKENKCNKLREGIFAWFLLTNYSEKIFVLRSVGIRAHFLMPSIRSMLRACCNLQNTATAILHFDVGLQKFDKFMPLLQCKTYNGNSAEVNKFHYGPSQKML